jgi:hypothetical protein
MTKSATDRRAAQSDRCRCRQVSSVVLVVTFGGDGLSCLKCNRLVSARRLGVAGDVTHSLRLWRDAETEVYSTWLVSGSKERWAAAQMRDLTTPVNRLARRLARRISKSVDCLVNFFQDERSQVLGRPRKCPGCRAVAATVQTKVGQRRVCRRCRLAWWAESRWGSAA